MADDCVKVSVMLLAYNHEAYIRKALDSVVMQVTDFKFEAVVGEDKSTDRTRAILREYAAEYPDIIKPLYWKKNMGASRNVVATLKRCTGEYVSFLECDDFWTDPMKLQRQVDFLDKNPQYAGVMCGVTVVNRYDKAMVTGPNVLDHELKTPLDFARTMWPYNQFKFLGCFMTRNYYRGGAYDKYLMQTRCVTDIILEAISVKQGRIGYMSEHMTAYRWIPSHGKNFSAMNTDVLCRDKIYSLRVVTKLFPKRSHKWIYMKISREYKILIDKYLREGEYSRLLKLLTREMTIAERGYYPFYHFSNVIRSIFDV